MKYLPVCLMVFSCSLSAQNKIEVKDAWARPAAKGANSALYCIIQNNGNKSDTLKSAESMFAEEVQIHESYKKDNDKMGMRQVKSLVLNSKSSAELKPGGFHVMLLGVKKDFKAGDPLNVTLQFRNSGKIKIKAVVRDAPEAGK